MQELDEAEGLLIFHPLWWGGPPAMLKGWMDRVLRQGVAYDLEGGDFSEKDWKPLLSGNGLVLVTSDDDGLESELGIESWGRACSENAAWTASARCSGPAQEELVGEGGVAGEHRREARRRIPAHARPPRLLVG